MDISRRSVFAGNSYGQSVAGWVAVGKLFKIKLKGPVHNSLYSRTIDLR